jgi:hypothetical protein
LEAILVKHDCEIVIQVQIVRFMILRSPKKMAKTVVNALLVHLMIYTSQGAHAMILRASISPDRDIDPKL